MRAGLISGSISTLVPAAINKFRQPKAPATPTPDTEAPEPLRPITEKQELLKTEVRHLQEPTIDMPKRILHSKQIQHKPVGEARGQKIGKSVLYGNEAGLIEGVRWGNYKVIRTISANKVIVDFRHFIGTYYDNGKYVGPSRYGVVTWRKTGVHIYPANPKQN